MKRLVVIIGTVASLLLAGTVTGPASRAADSGAIALARANCTDLTVTYADAGSGEVLRANLLLGDSGGPFYTGTGEPQKPSWTHAFVGALPATPVSGSVWIMSSDAVSILATSDFAFPACGQSEATPPSGVEPARPFDIPFQGIGALTLRGQRQVGSRLTLENDFIRQHREFFDIRWWHGCGDNASEYKEAHNKLSAKIKYRDHVEVIATVVKGYLKGGAFHTLAVTIRGTKNCMNF